MLRVFGCMVQYRPHTARAGRFSQRALWGLHLGIEKHYNAWKIFDVNSKELVAARDVIFYERLTLQTYLDNLAANRDLTGGFRGNRAFASAADEADWDEQNVDNASEEAGQLPYCSVPIPMDDENPRESVNAETYFDFADTGYVTPQPVDTNISERLWPNFLPDLEAGDEAAYPEDINLPRYTQSGLQILGLVTASTMDAEMASWKSTCTYVDEVPPPGANIVSGMWIFRVKRPPGSPHVFKARYVAQGIRQRQGVDYFQTFSPTPKMTTLRVLLHVAAQRDYELHSLDFSTAFLQGSLHEEIRLRRPPGFTGSFPPADPSLFLRTDTSLLPFYILVYVDDLVFATADTAGLAHVKSELQKRHTCTDLGELRSYLGLQITRDRAECTITLTQSHMVQQVLQRFDFTYSSPQATPLPTRHSLSALPSEESVEPSGPYPELVGCLMYLMTCTRPDLAYPLSILARYVAPGRHGPEHMAAAKRVLRYLCSTSGLGLVLGGRSPVVLTGHADASWVDDLATQRSSQGYTFSLGSGSVSWRSTRLSSVLSSSCEAEIYAGAMAAQELRWLTYLLTDLGEPPRSPPVLYVDNKAMLALCREHRLEHRTKHIALRYFLARELQQRGHLRLAYVASKANTADIFTKALPPGDHQRFCTMLGLVPTWPHLLTS
ncbi:unnamed protein product [Closterium sp. NIES-54]